MPVDLLARQRRYKQQEASASEPSPSLSVVPKSVGVSSANVTASTVLVPYAPSAAHLAPSSKKEPAPSAKIKLEPSAALTDCLFLQIVIP